MNEYIDLKHMTLVPKPKFNEPHYVIPHHCVFKLSSSTTKIRVVFDASAVTSSGISLNKILKVGPVIQSDLFAIALRFRFYTYVFTSDITKMYRQVSLHPDDRPFHYILWRPTPTEDIQVYELCTVTYGTASASFLATRALKQLAIDELVEFPLASKAALNDFYVDDILTGANTLAEAKSVQSQLSKMMSKGKLELKKWCANHPEIIEDIPNCDQEEFFEVKGENAIKTLGMVWCPKNDKFCYNKNLEPISIITKRTIASEIAQFFDPLVLINPVISLAKIFLQQLWRIKLSWDEALSQDLHSRWVKFRDSLKTLHDLRIDRQVFVPFNKYEIHAFSDSSESAYGACIYIRSISEDNEIQCKLLCAKSRVAPLKKCRLPYLELAAGVVMVQLVKRILNIFDYIKFERITYWTDSTIVLCWIREESCNWETFIANRVEVIQQTSNYSQWRHIPSLLNPADLLSRGTLPALLVKSRLWFSGPDFLQQNEQNWPQNIITNNYDDKFLQRKRIKLVLSMNFDKQLFDNFKYKNNYKKIINIFSYIFRFTHNVTCPKQNKILGPPTAEERQFALHAIIKYIQNIEFYSEIKALQNYDCVPRSSNLRLLLPFIDSHGLLRVGGRLKNSSLDFDSKHPLLLPKNHTFTRALMTHYHLENCCSTNADLPELRVQQTRPFNVVGVDFCGPFFTHYRRRGTVPTKSYVAIFVCFVTRAVHLELVEDLSTQSFISALRRFIGRRGRCSIIYSDNGTNMIGARNELSELYETLQKQQNRDQIINMCANERIKWKTIPPRSPHFGGLWEAAVKSFKYHLKRILQNTSLTFPELNTLIIQIESILNSRPITSIPENANDPPALTPGHFIIGTALNSLPDPDLKSTSNINRLQRYQLLQWYFQQFYLQSLQVRPKWTTHGSPVQIGDVVILQDDNQPPLQWKLGRVINIHPGKDGVVRTVTLKTANGTLQRATAKIRRLPVDGAKSIQGADYVDIYTNKK